VTDITFRDLHADCAACCGLCCVSPPFDADQGFGYDKPAHEACRHLQAGFRCGIHADRAAAGFDSCTSYDCLGAGQRTTRAFAPSDWREAPEHGAAIHSAFLRLRGLHELLSLLATARAMVEEPAWRQRLAAQAEGVDRACLALLATATGGPQDPLGTAAHAATLRRSTFALLRELASVPSVAARRPG